MVPVSDGRSTDVIEGYSMTRCGLPSIVYRINHFRLSFPSFPPCSQTSLIGSQKVDSVFGSLGSSSLEFGSSNYFLSGTVEPIGGSIFRVLVGPSV